MSSEELTWRWIESVHVFVSGGRVASLPCHHGTAVPLATDGSRNGGDAQYGMPSRSWKAGSMPCVRFGNCTACMNPNWCVVPDVVVTEPNDREYEARKTDLAS